MLEEPIFSEEEFVFGVDFSRLDTSLIIDEDIAPANDSMQECKTNLKNGYDDDCPFRIEQMLEIDKKGNFASIVLDDVVEDSDYEKAFEWAKRKGALLEGISCGKDAYGGRGLFANTTSSFSSGDVVAVLPRALRIGQVTACRRLRLPSTTPDLSALSLLVLDMALSASSSLQWKSEDDKEDFDAYAAVLPKHGQNALFMKHEEIQKWSNYGSQYKIDIRRVREQADACVRYIQDCLLGDHPKSSSDFGGSSDPSDTYCIKEDIFDTQFPALRWAIQIVQSRTHAFGTRRSRWMTPIFDFANHSASPNCKLEGDDGGRLILRAIQPIQAGDEITIDYQVPDDAKLFATYGFSILHQ